MEPEFHIHRLLGSMYQDTPEDREHVKKYVKLASGGAYPYKIREMMKQHAWEIISSDTTTKQEKEDAKLLICYSWWARALEGGIPKSKFEEFMVDHLNYLDIALVVYNRVRGKR